MMHTRSQYSKETDMGIQFTDEQQRLIKEAVRWYKYDSEQVLQYSAPAGAGKSTVMHAIINEL